MLEAFSGGETEAAVGTSSNAALRAVRSSVKASMGACGFTVAVNSSHSWVTALAREKAVVASSGDTKPRRARESLAAQKSARAASAPSNLSYNCCWVGVRWVAGGNSLTSVALASRRPERRVIRSSGFTTEGTITGRETSAGPCTCSFRRFRMRSKVGRK